MFYTIETYDGKVLDFFDTMEEAMNNVECYNNSYAILEYDENGLVEVRLVL